MNIKRAITHPIGITSIYIVVGFLWIFFSDYLVSVMVDPYVESTRAIQTFKGTLFVILSGLMIYVLISSQKDQLKQKIAEHKNDKDRLKTAQEIGQVGDWSYNIETGEMKWSEETYRIYGLDPRLPAPTRDNVRKIYTKKDRILINNAVEAAINEGISYDLDSEIIVNNTKKYIRNVGLPVKKNDRVVELRGIVQDITDRKKIELEKEHLNQRIKSIANNIPGAIFQYILLPDESEKLQYLSEGSRQLWGIAPEDVMGNENLLWNQIHEDDLPAVLNSIKKSAIDLAFWQISWRSHHPTKGLRWHEGSGQPVRQDDGSIIWNSIILDVTDRNKAQIEKNKLADRLNALADNLPGLLFQYRLDKNGEDSLEYLSKGTEDYFGLPPEQIMKDIELAWSRFHPEDLERVRNEIQYSALHLTAMDTEWRVDHPAKGTIWQHCIATPKRGTNGSVIWDTLILDITESKKNQLEVRETKNLLEKIINSIKEVVFLVDPKERKIIMANKAVEEIFGYKPEELIGKRSQLLYPSIEKYEEFSQVGEPKLEADGVFHTEFQMQHKNGTLIKTENTVTPIDEPLGFEAGVVSVVRDITLKKEAEEKLQQREEYLSLITDNASDGILACDKHGKLIFFNKQILEWIGRQINPSLPRHEWPEQYGLYTSDGQRLLKEGELSIVKALKNGEVTNHRFMVKPDNKPPRHLESNGRALYDQNGNLMGAMVVIRDITDRINRDIETSNAILEALDNERQEIASDIHDSLTQTLSIVSQNLKNLLLSDNKLGQSDKFKKAQEFLENAINESRDLSHRIMPKSIEDFGLIAATEELTDSLEKAHKIKIELEYNKEFRLDKNIEINVYRIIQEAISNSVKHADPSEIKISINQTDGTLKVRVRDNGIGITKIGKEVKGIGIRTMKSRALKLNASLVIKPDTPGTLIELKVPLG